MFFGLPPADPGIELTVASHGMSKGLGQTEGPQIVPRAFARFGRSWRACKRSRILKV
jgi:hypothetical protein